MFFSGAFSISFQKWVVAHQHLLFLCPCCCVSSVLLLHQVGFLVCWFCGAVFFFYISLLSALLPLLLIKLHLRYFIASSSYWITVLVSLLPSSASKPFASSVLSLHICGNAMQRFCGVTLSAMPAYSIPINADVFGAVTYCESKVDKLLSRTCKQNSGLQP